MKRRKLSFLPQKGNFVFLSGSSCIMDFLCSVLMNSYQDKFPSLHNESGIALLVLVAVLQHKCALH